MGVKAGDEEREKESVRDGERDKGREGEKVILFFESFFYKDNNANNEVATLVT